MDGNVDRETGEMIVNSLNNDFGCLNSKGYIPSKEHKEYTYVTQVSVYDSDGRLVDRWEEE